MKVIPEKMVIYDDECENIICTVTGVDQDIIEVTMKDLWISTDEEIDELCRWLKASRGAYEAGL